MAFDIDRLFSFVSAEVSRFAATHSDETFYAFALDAALVCLNSEERFRQSLAGYQSNWERDMREILSWDELTKRDLSQSDYLLQLTAQTQALDRNDKGACLKVINESRSRRRAKGNPYLRKEKIEDLRYNTGDWEYQGFATMTNAVGFDDKAYAEHYDMNDEEQRVSAYGLAMDELVARLQTSDIFSSLKRTPDFRIYRVEHDY